MHHVLTKGTTQKLLLVYEENGATGLRHDTAGASAAYVREGEVAARTIRLVEGTPGEYRRASFVEVDPELAPGVYQLGVPDEMLAEGAESATLILRFPGARIDTIEVSLVAYDPQDSDRLGMLALGPEGRIAALRGAFPRLTAKELLGSGVSSDS